jgi:hypothetical protein
MTTTGCRQRLNLGARFGDAPLACCLPQDINQAEVRAKLALPSEGIKRRAGRSYQDRILRKWLGRSQRSVHALEMKPRVVQLKFDACPKIAVRH